MCARGILTAATLRGIRSASARSRHHAWRVRTVARNLRVRRGRLLLHDSVGRALRRRGDVVRLRDVLRRWRLVHRRDRGPRSPVYLRAGHVGCDAGEAMSSCGSSLILAALAALGGCACGAGTGPGLPGDDAGTMRADASDASDGAVIDAGAIGACDPTRVRPMGGPPVGGECETDADCVDGVNGRCSIRFHATECTYDECFTDADCRPGYRCACDAGTQRANLCLPDHCDSCPDSDCAVSWGCEGPGNHPPYGAMALECHTPEDQCRTDADCGLREFCTRGPSLPCDPTFSRWQCLAVMCGG